MKLLLAGILSAAALLVAAPAGADPGQCDVYDRSCYPAVLLHDASVGRSILGLLPGHLRPSLRPWER